MRRAFRDPGHHPSLFDPAPAVTLLPTVCTTHSPLHALSFSSSVYASSPTSVPVCSPLFLILVLAFHPLSLPPAFRFSFPFSFSSCPVYLHLFTFHCSLIIPRLYNFLPACYVPDFLFLSLVLRLHPHRFYFISLLTLRLCSPSSPFEYSLNGLGVTVTILSLC